ncbi:MAG: serine hydrolase, partial [Bacteroidaceae bacterium]|nr:serine hydrolase [Bacteroidaceae bacterium]
MRSIWKYLFAALFIVLPFIGNAQHLPIVRPEKVGMDSQRLLRADSAIEDAIKKGNIPGAVLAVVRHGKVAYLKAYGNRQTWPVTREMTTNTIFDMASCSKAMSTAISTLILCEQGHLRLLDAVNQYIPDFEDWRDENGETTTIRIQHLLTHTSGLP